AREVYPSDRPQLLQGSLYHEVDPHHGRLDVQYAPGARRLHLVPTLLRQRHRDGRNEGLITKTRRNIPMQASSSLYTHPPLPPRPEGEGGARSRVDPLPFSLWEKGLGDEGEAFRSSGLSSICKDRD